MTFGADFRFLVAKRIAGFAITILAAWLLRSYWALVIGTLAGRAFGVVLSYFIHPMRPRLSLAKMREIFGISQWLMVRGIGNFVETNLHRFVVGGREPAAIMGAYSLADDIAKLPTATLLTPLNRVLFPAFVAAKNDLAELKRMFLLAQGVQALIGIPSAIGLTLVAREAVLVLLGERWIAAVPFVQLLSPVALIASITAAGAHVLLTLGHVRTLAYLLWIRIALFATAAYLVLPGASALDIAWLRGGFAAVTLAGFVGWARRYIPQLSAMEFARSVIRPLLAAAIMAGAVLSLHALDTTGMRTVTLLLVKIGVGALAYPLSVLLLWQLAGRPPGAESYLLDKLRRRG
jgi:O-antigen/teichoic acid export membrane protein